MSFTIVIESSRPLFVNISPRMYHLRQAGAVMPEIIEIIQAQRGQLTATLSVLENVPTLQLADLNNRIVQVLRSLMVPQFTADLVAQGGPIIDSPNEKREALVIFAFELIVRKAQEILNQRQDVILI